MSKYILLIISISVFQSGCYTSLEKRYNHVKDKDKIIGQWYMDKGEVSSSNGVIRASKITYYLTFYRDESYCFGIDSPPYEPNGRYKCNNDTLKIAIGNTSELYLMKYLKNDYDMELEFLSTADSVSNKSSIRINYEGLWRRK